MSDATRPALPEIEIVEPLGRSWEHMKSALFPFDFKIWITLGFVSWLTYLGGGSVNFSRFRTRGRMHVSVGPEIQDFFRWMDSHGPQLPLLIVGGVGLLFILAVVFAYLKSRATFVYLDDVWQLKAELARPWRETRQLAHSFFIWRVIFTLGQLCVFMALGTMLYLLFRTEIRNDNFTPDVILRIMLAILFASPVLLVVGIANWSLGALVAPIMYLRNVTGLRAWSILGGLLKGNVGAFFLFWLMNAVVGLLFAVLTLVAVFCTCCIGALPVVNQTVLQPFLYWIRGYSLYFLAQFGPEYPLPRAEADLLRPASIPAAPTPQAPAAETHAPPRIGVCPQCGQQHAIPDNQPGTYSCVRCGARFQVS
jgi:hypothetical protein